MESMKIDIVLMKIPVFWALVASKKLKNVLKTLGFRAGKAEPNPLG
jgi:hypothetical protein